MIRRPRVCLATLIAVVVAQLGATAGPASAAGSGPDCGPAATFHARNFPTSPRVDNKWFPLVPGARFVLKGTVVEDGVTHRHEIVTTVTDLTKVLDGVRTVVVFDRDYDNGELEESELAFMAQDHDGRVWNLGEYPEEYVDGHLRGAPSTWIAGIAQARAGVGMLTDPRVGGSAYLQGVAPKVEFRDCAKVVQTGQRVCVPVGCYHDVLVTDEWAPLDPEGGHQRKYYAPGVGNVRVGAVGGTNPEVLELSRLTKLGAKALADVREEVLKQDRRGYRVSPRVYGCTPPAS
jgi:hypothetical protein